MREHFSKINMGIKQQSPRKYPGEMTLNHTMRRKEVDRINKANTQIL